MLTPGAAQAVLQLWWLPALWQPQWGTEGDSGSVQDGGDVPSHSCLIYFPELTHDLEIKELEARQQGKSTGCA